jgi:hypothetical protein
MYLNSGEFAYASAGAAPPSPFLMSYRINVDATALGINAF